LQQIVIATTNPGKAREFQDILGSVAEVLVPSDLPPVLEDGETLAENAYKKARSAADYLGRVAIADDSGLFVAALDGEPGVHSARFAGPESDDASNRSKLISLMAGILDRSAYFETVLCMSAPSATMEEAAFFHGRCDGRLLDHELGENGFGYDALFIPAEGDGRTFAEMAPHEKAMLSHRARAISSLRTYLTGSSI
jgi:XTP/dITP diphosphohydrolase